VRAEGRQVQSGNGFPASLPSIVDVELSDPHPTADHWKKLVVNCANALAFPD